jgi:uncharacterized damage-inducible protein DinB
MNLAEHVRLMANYNQAINTQIYTTASKLSAAELSLDRQAFFGSILGTLNHILVGDIIWLKRFAQHPANYAVLEMVRSLPQPTGLAQLLIEDFGELRQQRQRLDAAIVNWAEVVTDAELNYVLHYTNTKGIPGNKCFFSLIMHFFNHQTHHRGQVTTLLSQMSLDIGVTDLLNFIPHAEHSSQI